MASGQSSYDSFSIVFISIKQPISSFLRVAHLILNSVKYFSETAFLQGSFMVNRYKASVNPEFDITSPSWHGVRISRVSAVPSLSLVKLSSAW